MIGIFDSGYGGLTVLKGLLARLPQYDYLYLGDNGRAPYGGRDPETILRYSKEAVNFLFGEGCRLILIACNTVSAVALKTLQEEYIRKPRGGANKADAKLAMGSNILGVIFPLAEEAASISRGGRVGVVGTRATIESMAYEHELKKLRPKAVIYGQACPLLVPFIEEGWESKPEALTILRKYLRPLKTYNLDTLILGCTHYPLMIKNFKRTMGKNVQVLDPGPIIAESLKKYLERHPEIETGLNRQGDKTIAPGRRIFKTTGDPKCFAELGSRFLGVPVTGVSKVALTR